MENSNHLTESWSLPWQSVLSSQLWRLEHLYWIENKAGQLQRFSLNRAQRRLHERLWYRNDILKARQLGISTYVAMLMLDMSLFRSNFHCGIIDKSLPDAQQKLAKLHFAWDHLDYGVTKQYLIREYEKAMQARTTQPCNRACAGCGANNLLGRACFDYR